MKKFLLLLTLLLTGAFLHAQQTFTNPLLPSGADPWSIYKDGYYYYTNSTGRNITIWKTNSIAALATAEKKVVWAPPETGPYSKELWAPEIHYLQGKWYIYFAADSGNNVDHRLYVLENKSADPLKGEWVFKSKLTTPDDKWAIDGSVFENRGQLYLIWSGWEGATSKLLPDTAFTSHYEEDEFALAFARIEVHYFANKGFFETDDQLLRDVPRIRHIPGVIVQGRYDVVCPMESAWALHRAWPEAELIITPDSGHSAFDPPNARALVAATDKFAG